MSFQIIQETEAMPVNCVNILIYGEPGIGKTSIASTSSKSLLFDTDKGSHRSEFRKASIRVVDWQKDVVSNIESLETVLKDYDTIIIDTVDTCLETMGAYLVKQNYKLGSNKLQYYGALKDEFAKFINMLRTYGKDIIMIAHVKEKDEGDVSKKRPAITGGTYDKVLQLADMVGFQYSFNNKRTINFNPTDTNVGKNTANIEVITIPNFNQNPEFFAEIISQIKGKFNNQSQAQADAVNSIADFNKRINEAKDSDTINAIVSELVSSKLSKAVKEQIKVNFTKRVKELGLEKDKTTGIYSNPAKAEIEEKVKELIEETIEAPVEEPEFV
jgi:phage nucleotide-binding protein